MAEAYVPAPMKILGVTQGELAVAKPGNYQVDTLASSEANPCVIVAAHWHHDDQQDQFATAMTHMDDRTDVEQTIGLLVSELAAPKGVVITITVASGASEDNVTWTRAEEVLGGDAYDLINVELCPGCDKLTVTIKDGQTSTDFNSMGIYGDDLLQRLNQRRNLCEPLKKDESTKSEVTFRLPPD